MRIGPYNNVLSKFFLLDFSETKYLINKKYFERKKERKKEMKENEWTNERKDCLVYGLWIDDTILILIS